jgi:hypothetical protein
MNDVVKIYTANDVATLLKVDYKTVLNLLRRGQLHALPRMRHKRITETELNRYLGIKTASVNTVQSSLACPMVKPTVLSVAKTCQKTK